MAGSEVVQTILSQVIAGCEPSAHAAIRGLMAVDDETLRVQVKTGSLLRNTDIRYDVGSDTYTVTRHRGWDGVEFHRSITTEGHHAEDLAALCFDAEGER